MLTSTILCNSVLVFQVVFGPKLVWISLGNINFENISTSFTNIKNLSPLKRQSDASVPEYLPNIYCLVPYVPNTSQSSLDVPNTFQLSAERLYYYSWTMLKRSSILYTFNFSKNTILLSVNLIASYEVLRPEQSCSF